MILVETSLLVMSMKKNKKRRKGKPKKQTYCSQCRVVEEIPKEVVDYFDLIDLILAYYFYNLFRYP